MSQREQADDCVTCYYCNNWVSSRHEHDHFPEPKACGGTEVVTACINCHDLKDRIPLDRWPVGLVAAGMSELVRDTPAIRLRGLDVLAWDALTTVFPEHEALYARWGAWKPATRLYYAKVLSIKHHREHVRAKSGDFEVD